jgi:hypothetical protein
MGLLSIFTDYPQVSLTSIKYFGKQNIPKMRFKFFKILENSVSDRIIFSQSIL